VTDPGALVRHFRPPAAAQKRHNFSFVPHWSSSRAGGNALRKVCEEIGFGYIDPFWPVEKVLAAIDETGTLVAEAMHGAILADALRVPWIPVTTTRDILQFKWRDWSSTLNIPLRMQHALTPELRIRRNRNAAIYDVWGERGIIGRARLRSAVTAMKRHLATIAETTKPHLSEESVLDERIAELLSRRDRLRDDILARSTPVQ
jgi:succinoglycan biosynthesis protein ExoV